MGRLRLGEAQSLVHTWAEPGSPDGTPAIAQVRGAGSGEGGCCDQVGFQTQGQVRPAGSADGSAAGRESQGGVTDALGLLSREPGRMELPGTERVKTVGGGRAGFGGWKAEKCLFLDVLSLRGLSPSGGGVPQLGSHCMCRVQGAG